MFRIEMFSTVLLLSSVANECSRSPTCERNGRPLGLTSSQLRQGYPKPTIDFVRLQTSGRSCNLSPILRSFSLLFVRL